MISRVKGADRTYKIDPLFQRTKKGLFTMLLGWEAAVGFIALLIVELLPRQLIGIFGAGNESAY